MATARVLVTAGDLTVFALLDEDDAVRLGDRSLSLGSHGYAQMTCYGHNTLLHRWVMGAAKGDGRIVDHINGSRLDCRKVNLRFVTASESSSNVRGRAVSGFRGVYMCRGRYQARAKLHGCLHNLGTYATPQEAAAVSHAWRLENLPGYTGRDIAA